MMIKSLRFALGVCGPRDCRGSVSGWQPQCSCKTERGRFQLTLKTASFMFWSVLSAGFSVCCETLTC